MTWPRDRRGASPGDTLIFLATLSVAAALLYPAWSVRDFRARVDGAVEDVETLRAAAGAVRDDTGRWPTPSAPGQAPPELAGLVEENGVFSRTGYTVGWTSFEVVDSIEAPRPSDIPSADDAPRADAAPLMEPIVRSVGAITVRSGEDNLLAELLDRYSEGASFVLDSMWLLVLPERGQPPVLP